MQKTLTTRGKRYTAKQIVKLPKTETNGGDFAVRLNGKRFYWNYREIQDEFFAPVCSPDRANAIALMPDDGFGEWSVWLSL
jgi:hypothetical protein